MSAGRLSLSLMLTLGLLSAAVDAQALPMYAQRSGRTCGNCHVSPTYQDPKGWLNPELADRKCNMSCIVCHTNPAGGGLRNASGRYYGQSTLSMLPTQERSYTDVPFEILPQSWINWARQLFDWAPSEERAAGDKTIPSNEEEVEQGIGAGARGGFAAFGKPLFGPSRYAFWDGRYADLNADPLLQLGADLRGAWWSASGNVFPMQGDLHAALHPIEHLTLMATGAVQGGVGTFTSMQERGYSPVFARNAFVMAHEFPYASYAKAGIFLPPFGTHQDDHTSMIREYFEMDLSTQDDTVLGVELGMAPNYPFINLAAFTNRVPVEAPGDGLDGWGLSTSFGWRDLGWSVTAHGMLKRRSLAARGDLDAAGVGWGFNPAYYIDWLRITYMGELSFGRRQRPVTGNRASYWASYHELWWMAVNGINLRLKYDVGNRDTDVAGDLEQRYSAGIDLSFMPGVTWLAQIRMMELTGLRDGDWDALITAHIWF